MRRFVPLMAVTLLGGCGAIPPAIGLMSYAVDGVSLLASGKTLSDHAISAASDQDCKLFRMAQNLEVCTAWGTEPKIAAVRPVRVSDRDDLDSWGNDIGAVQVAFGPVPLAPEKGVPMALPAHMADVAKALPGVARAETTPALATALIEPPKPVVQPPVVPQSGKLVMTALVPSAPVSPTVAPLPPMKAELAKGDLSAVVRSDDTQARRDAVRAAYEGRYLMVLGSFKGSEIAGRLAKLHQGAKVVKVDVSGETYYRVVIEPEKGAKFASKLSDKPWLMPVPAAGVQQVASLQGTLR